MTPTQTTLFPLDPKPARDPWNPRRASLYARDLQTGLVYRFVFALDRRDFLRLPDTEKTRRPVSSTAEILPGDALTAHDVETRRLETFDKTILAAIGELKKTTVSELTSECRAVVPFRDAAKLAASLDRLAAAGRIDRMFPDHLFARPDVTPSFSSTYEK